MRTTIAIIAFAVLALCMWTPVLVYAAKGGFRKPCVHNRKYVQVPAKPGTVIELVADDGVVIAMVMLHHITHDNRMGTSAEFVDFTHYMQDRRVDRIAYDGPDRRQQG